MHLPVTRPKWQRSQPRASTTSLGATPHPCCTGRPLSQHSLQQQQRRQQPVLTTRRLRHVDTAAAAAATEPAEASSGTSSSTAIQLSRLQRFQDMLGDIPAQQQQPTPIHPGGQSTARPTSKKVKAVGFGGQSTGSNSSRQQQQPQVVVKPLDSCPCKSGLQYQVGPGARGRGVACRARVCMGVGGMCAC
jgi:hypothetical protein